MTKKKNILVTGGAGFIGSHLCDELVREHNVVCVDNFITGQEENIDQLLEHPNFEFIRHDITAPFDVNSFPELKKFQIESLGFQEIFHLACPTSPKEYHRVPLETLRTNAIGTLNICEIASKYKARLVHLSTSAVYGEPLSGQPFVESYLGMVSTTGPRSCYNEGKRFSETIVANYSREYEFHAMIVRVFNTYGPRMRVDDGRMIPDFIVDILNRNPVSILGGPDDASSYVYVSDVVDALRKVMELDSGGLDIVNVGSDTLVTFVDVATAIMRKLGIDVPVEYHPHPPYTQSQGIPDISKIKDRLGWFPIVATDAGLTKTIEYIKARVKKKDLR